MAFPEVRLLLLSLFVCETPPIRGVFHIKSPYTKDRPVQYLSPTSAMSEPKPIIVLDFVGFVTIRPSLKFISQNYLRKQGILLSYQAVKIFVFLFIQLLM